MMTCADAVDRMNRYLDGTIEPTGLQAVGSHLATCAECREAFETGAWVQARAASLPRAIAPGSDLWAGIAPRLRPRVRRLAVPLWALAAAAALLVALSSAATVALIRPRAQAVAGFSATEAGYRRAALELSDLYRRGRDSLAPETRVVLERSLVVIERALAESRAALAVDPANRNLEALVAAAYKRKIAFLERATTLGAT